MERATTLAAGLLGLCLSSTAFAFIPFDGSWGLGCFSFKPAIGFDVNARHQPFHTSFGEEHFRHDYPDTNFYIAARLHQYFGLEAGYEHMYSLYKQQWYGEDLPVLGANHFEGLEGELFLSRASMDGWHIDAVGFWPVCPTIDLTLNLGISWMKMRYETAFHANQFPAASSNFWESDTRAVTRIGIGFRHMLTCNFGLRLQAEWEDTSKLSATTPLFPEPVGPGADNPTVPSDNYTVKPKDSYLIGLGFFLEFS